MLIHLCTAHSINSAKTKLMKLHPNDGLKFQLGLRFFGRLISCCEREDCRDFIRPIGYVVMTSEHGNATVEESIHFLEDSINTFLRKNNEETVVDSCKDESKSIKAESETTENDFEEIQPDSDNNVWQDYWANATDEFKDNWY